MIRSFQAFSPEIGTTNFLAETAVLIGQVFMEEHANVWYNTVVRGDVEPIRIGKNSNVQDLVMVHTSSGFPVIIGDDVTIGHNATIHGCTIESNVLIGMGAIILDGAHIEKDVIIGAGSLVPPGKRIPSKSLVMGSPAKVVRTLSEEEIESIGTSAHHYVELSKQYNQK
ncbi:MAG: gamma carbonic anhydrase family protein [Clostridia bacterium]|nr:gamma carbonic anhydrase family protein [Clostridia bacterium]